MIGTVLSHYRVVEKIGEGGMGEVYRADDLRLPRSVAIKLLPDKALSSPERRERFIREARAASSLNHPGIVHVYDVDESEGHLYIAMEYVEGKTVAEILGERRLSIDEILRIGIEAGDAVVAAHAHGIVHRDIKPSNIMVAAGGFVKILDFGLAKLLRPDVVSVPPDAVSTRAPNLTRHGQLIGTVLYMSPELALGEDVDARSDVFSFGAVLYEMASGRLPFTGSSEVAILDKIIHAFPPPLSQVQPDVPEPLGEIVSKAMEKRKEDRYQTLEDLLVDLRRLRRDAEAVGAGRGGRLGSWTRRARRDPAARRALLWGGLVVLLAVAAALVADRGSGGGGNAADRTARSIAVFPFENSGADPDGKYFSDGVTEGIIVDLSRIAGLKVLAPPSGARREGESPVEAGRRLDADMVLEGRVQRYGGQIRVSSSLRHARDGQVIWADRIDRPLKGVFELQDEVSHQIAGALQFRLTSDEKAKIARVPTSNLRAYDLYMRGRELVKRRVKPDLLRAIPLFEHALTQDSDFALAYAGLADAYAVAQMYDWELGEEALSRARRASERAIELDPTLPEAHTSLGVVAAASGDPLGGISRIQHAVSLAPESATAHHWLSIMYKSQGRLEEAESEARRAVECDPDLGVAHLNLAHIAILKGDPAAAALRMEAVIAAEPTLRFARVLLAWARILEGRPSEALAVLEAAWAVSPDDPLIAGLRGLALAASGDRAGAREAARRAAALSDANPSSLAEYAVASVYAQTGARSEAFEYLERALERRARGIRVVISGDFVRRDPGLAALRGDPRFEALLGGF